MKTKEIGTYTIADGLCLNFVSPSHMSAWEFTFSLDFFLGLAFKAFFSFSAQATTSWVPGLRVYHWPSDSEGCNKYTIIVHHIWGLWIQSLQGCQAYKCCQAKSDYEITKLVLNRFENTQVKSELKSGQNQVKISLETATVTTLMGIMHSFEQHCNNAAQKDHVGNGLVSVHLWNLTVTCIPLYAGCRMT